VPPAPPEAAGEETAPPLTGPVFSKDGRRLINYDPAKVAAYNFRNPGFLSPTDLRQLELLHQRLLHHLAARLSTFFRMECLLKMVNFTNSTFASFCQSLGNPTHLTLFQVASLRGVGIVELALPLSHAMSDRLLGGKGRASDVGRILTEIEATLLEDVINLMLTEWIQLRGEEAYELQPVCIGHENSGRFLQTAASDSVFVVMTVEMSLGEMVEKFQLGVPFTMLETVVKKLGAKHPSEDAKPKQIQWRKQYASISVPVTAEWDVREVSLREIVNLAEGDLLQLPRSAISQTRIVLSPSEEFIGTTGVQNGHIAVELTQRINKE
jgi:flagellar motor switch protein FliM